MALLGAHASVAGGLHLAFDRAEALDCRATQIFVKNPNQWQGSELTDEAVRTFRRRRRDSTVEAVVAHASYLINMAATDERIRRLSLDGLADELERCERLGVDGLVLHPGAHLGAGEELGIERIAASIRVVLGRRKRWRTRLLLENTAGQGTLLGYRLEQLAAIKSASRYRRTVGFCLDTCHAFAAGYAIHRPAGFRRFVGAIDTLLGFEHVGCLHLNDSQQPFASRRDRHANIGAGEIGAAAFRRLLREPAMSNLAMILETPIGDGRSGHQDDLDLLRSWS